jgi:hypothetical protein
MEVRRQSQLPRESKSEEGPTCDAREAKNGKPASRLAVKRRSKPNCRVEYLFASAATNTLTRLAVMDDIKTLDDVSQHQSSQPQSTNPFVSAANIQTPAAVNAGASSRVEASLNRAAASLPGQSPNTFAPGGKVRLTNYVSFTSQSS